MRHSGLKLRMVVAGTVLFAFYAALASVAFSAGLGLPIVLAGTVAFAGVQYVLGKKLALRSVDARDLPESEYTDVHRRVERLSDEMGVEKPRLMVGRMGVPNAFAVGRKGAGVVVVSESILELLDNDELEGVLAHELAHISNRDVVLMVLGQSVASLLGIATFWVLALADDSILMTVVAWIVGTLVQFVAMLFVLAISRYREYVADTDAADATGDPEALARALAKLAEVGRHEDAPDVSDGVGALCIFGGKRGLLAAVTATHPPMEKRVARLAPHLLEEAEA
jgi:heat shock protein HtpX